MKNKKTLAIISAALLAVAPVAGTAVASQPVAAQAIHHSSGYVYKGKGYFKIKVKGRKGKSVPVYKSNGRRAKVSLRGQGYCIFTNIWKHIRHRGICCKIAGYNYWVQRKYLPHINLSK